MAGSLPLVLTQSVLRVVAEAVPRNARDPAPTLNLCLEGKIAMGPWSRQELAGKTPAKVTPLCLAVMPSYHLVFSLFFYVKK